MPYNVYQAKARVSAMTAGMLARFAGGLTWDAIVASGNGNGRAWWRTAIADAEDRGLIAWDRGARVWRLTAEGSAHTRSIE